MALAESRDEYAGSPGLSHKDAILLQRLIALIHKDMGRLSSDELSLEIIKRSRPVKSPTHHLYEWDLAKGHALYLLERTRRLVMAVRVVFVEAPEEEPVRAYPVVTMNGIRGPAPMRVVMSDKAQAAQMLELALADLERWKRRYDHLKRLAPILQAIDNALPTVKKNVLQRKRGTREVRPSAGV